MNDPIVKTTEAENRLVFIVQDSGPSGQTNYLIERFLRDSLKLTTRTSVLSSFEAWNKATGGYIHLNPDLGFLPVLVGNDGQSVSLYEFVEALDGLIDYDELQGEFPNLSFAQINSAISFLRKMAQFNIRGIDLDALEDERLIRDDTLLIQLEKAFKDQETYRVLDLDK